MEQGISPAAARERIRLVMLVNDVSLRNLIPGELDKGFGFFQSKPSSAFSPVAVTPDVLGDAWREGKLHLPMLVTLNGKPFGQANAGIDMTFDFGQLIAHAAKTRDLVAETQRQVDPAVLRPAADEVASPFLFDRRGDARRRRLRRRPERIAVEIDDSIGQREASCRE